MVCPAMRDDAGDSMKKLIAGSLAALALGVSLPALAADLSPHSYVKAPPLQAVASWTGCYLGANAGGGLDRQAYTNVNPNRLPNFDLGSERNVGAVGGGQIGCDYQIGGWVVGVQGLFDAAGFRGSNHVVPGPTDPQSPNIFDLSSRTSWIATATARLGFAVQPQLLLYAKGGAAWERSSLDYTITGMGVANFSGSEQRTGWTVGGGLEYLIAPNWSVFAEYDHMDFGIDTLATQDRNVSNNSPPEPIRLSHRTDIGLVGLNYRFGMLR
jgi:outer membrane immunogenic protein